MKIYMVYEISRDSYPCLMEVFDSRKKATGYVREKKKEFKEDSYKSHYFTLPNYDIIVRELK